ncbi:MAG: hypothetical protein OEZ55_12355 [Nitrospinota bacterium]|nr:hypothetical protein [Nitrospinota bacterium]MDH5757446.1 hypothetical protein [Nitrospinota bacterium]
MKKPVCLFVINGMGMGNSTRCYALMQKLAPTMEIHVFTSGNGTMFLQDKKEVTSLTESEAYFYASKEGGISAVGTLASITKLYRIYQRKTKKLDDLVEKLRPDIMILDSEYSLGPARKRGIPVAALNNSDVVVSDYFRRDDLPSSIRSQFWLVEFWDYTFHKLRLDMVISPSLRPDTPRHPNFKRVGVMLRTAFEEMARSTSKDPFPSPRKMKRVVFMLSGSVFASNITGSLSQLPYDVEVVGREGVSEGAVTYHGKTMNSVDILKNADILVINGGFLAVSEAAALRKPTFVIPVPNHAEQVVNAQALKDLGLGYITDEASVIDQIKRLYEIDRWEGLATDIPPINFNGSSEAAEAVMDLLTRSGHGR